MAEEIGKDCRQEGEGPGIGKLEAQEKRAQEKFPHWGKELGISQFRKQWRHPIFSLKEFVLLYSNVIPIFSNPL